MNEHDASEIRNAINTSTIFTLPKSKLEQFAAILATPNAYSYFSKSEYENYRNIISSTLANISQHESARQISESINKNQKWWNKPLGIIFLAAMGATLASSILYIFFHYFGLSLNG